MATGRRAFIGGALAVAGASALPAVAAHPDWDTFDDHPGAGKLGELISMDLPQGSYQVGDEVTISGAGEFSGTYRCVFSEASAFSGWQKT